MPIIPWKPFRELENFFEEDWLKWTPEKSIPRMDVYENEKNIVAEIEIPGLSPEDISVEVKDDVLSIETKKKKEEEKKGKGYYRREISSGYHRRTVALPAEVQGEKAEAEYKEGILKVTIPKIRPSKPEGQKPIKIKVK